MLKKVTFVLVSVVVFFATFLITGYVLKSFSPVPCEKPITYTLGTVDKRFGISQADFLKTLVQAEEIWEKHMDRELFVYTPESGEIPVNLIYDSRQETTNTLSHLGEELEENETNYKILQDRYKKLKVEYETAKDVYNSLVETFNERSRAHESQVESWNRSKRNSKEQFDKLEAERVSLEFEAEKLKTLESQLNKVVEEINALVGTLNRMAQSLNLTVETYNTIGDTRGESFIGGLFIQLGEEKGIDIYEFSSRDKLVRILAHEFGHALGLDHLDDPEAIMYYLNEGDASVLSEADIAALRALCYNEDITKQ